MRVLHKIFKIACCVFLLAAMPFGHVDSKTFAVVVNADNTFDGSGDDAENLIRRLYLKQLYNWPSKDSAIVFARPPETEEEIAFRRIVLGMNERELSAHWLNRKQRKGETPPRAIGSTRLLLRQLSLKQHAFGVIEKSDLEKLDASAGRIRILFEFNDDTFGD